MNPCRKIHRWSFFLILLLSFCSCDSNPSDVDSPQEDGDLEQEEEASIPQEIHHCFEGNKQADRCETASDCEVESRCGEAPEGVSYTCSEGACNAEGESTEDGDSDALSDGDTPDDDDDDNPSDGDVDSTDGDTDIECLEEETGRGQIACLPTCLGNDDLDPCKTDFHFAYTDDQGHFEIGLPIIPGRMFQVLYGSDVWDDWIVFFNRDSTERELQGIMLFDYLTKQTAMFSSALAYKGGGGLYPGINQGKAVFSRASLDGETTYSHVLSLDLATLTLRDITEPTPSTAAMMRTQYSNGYYYWKNCNNGFCHLMSLDAEGQVVRLDTLSGYNGVFYYSTYEDKVVYWGQTHGIVQIDRTAGTESYLVEFQAQAGMNPYLVGDKLYWSDNRYSTVSIADGCGFSVFEYDLTTQEERVLVRTEDGSDDQIVEDVWEDWLVYGTYFAGSDGLGAQGCRNNHGDSDLMLMYLPTGETWKISDEPGREWQAHMWGHLVIWSSSYDPSGGNNVEYEDLHGIDLCMHPELKDRFPECAGRK